MPTTLLYNQSRNTCEPEAYDSLPSLRNASQNFQNTKAEGVLSGPIRDLFLEHKVRKHFASPFCTSTSQFNRLND